MTTPGSDRLDGGTAGVTWPFRPTELYRKVTGPFQRATKRTAGPAPGTPWDTPSTLDEVTCLAEDLSVVLTATDPFTGEVKDHTLSDLVIQNFKMLSALYGAAHPSTTP